ncbi:MAG: hypothetical protein ACK5S7_11635, partial [Dolichospermum sp.]
MTKIKATELQYQAVFEQKLIAANSNLKRERIKVQNWRLAVSGHLWIKSPPPSHVRRVVRSACVSDRR